MMITQEVYMDQLMKYTIQLAMLSTLLDEKHITEREYAKIKAELDRNYNRYKV
ncbi:SHOCT domain-containing protein [Abyssisolibacter fermentans]|uniref:SHOCT domain-containing protein n=1 Tax=Abyssisolibacter fermentans TaxID=1766203 RepID=UPI00308438C3